MKKMILIMLCCSIFPWSSKAQTKEIVSNDCHQWYIGIHGGIPFGVSTFSSFASDKTHFSFGEGLYVGYRLHRLLSSEMYADYCHLTLAARSCCDDAGYWLGNNGIRYFTPAANMDGWKYSALQSGIDMYTWGLRFNVDMLHLLAPSAPEKWQVSLSPSVGTALSKAHITDTDEDKDVINGDTKWHFTAGGSIITTYRICQKWSVGLYSGLTFFGGDHFDGMPNYQHHQNFVWQTGARLTFNFSRKMPKSPSYTNNYTTIGTETYNSGSFTTINAKENIR